MKVFIFALAFALTFAAPSADAAQKKAKDKNAKPDHSKVFNGLKFRNIGPAITSGRITDFAMTPGKFNRFFAATASGGLWLTENNGTSWTPVFDKYGSYSIGVVEIDPNNHDVVWVGSGENNSQRSVAYGDGVYKSVDGGKSFKNMGLKTSEHIGQIIIHPDDSDTVFVASQGPLWNAGGDRGLFKTTDGGTTWQNILSVDEHTGINEVVMHTGNPDMMVASSYQRRRHLWTLINGGPASDIYRTTDGGDNWSKITAGLPGGDKGRIGLAMAPSDPNVLYAIIEADDEGKGVYRSADFGVTWKKQSDYMTGSPQYYNELVVDPHNPNRVYVMDTWISVSEDGGKTWKPLGKDAKHPDEHVLWIDPSNTDHLITGNDGGIYESWDRGQQWRHTRNLPITQFYKIHADNALPFYNVYGGTQDNNSLGAPSRTTDSHGIANADWLITWGGDGFETVVDPTDPNVIYSQYQYGGLGRIDLRSGEKMYITPPPKAGENSLRWNWNSPVMISPHNNKRIYYASETLFRSDDQGSSWSAISGDLTHSDVDRNNLKVMGRIWSPNTIAKNTSTSVWHSIVAIDESTIAKDVLIVGTDDGLIQITENGGESWKRIDLAKIKGAPALALVEDVMASRYDAKTFFAVIDNHKKGDFKPYVMKTTDGGKSWKSISNDLPERGTVHTIVQDHVDRNLLFVGTEFGVFYSQNGGKNWVAMKNGLPVIGVRDMDIQVRENDLVVGTFGRGIYILDDYSPLRSAAATVAADSSTLFEIKNTLLYLPTSRWGGGKKGSQGYAFYQADNPPYGAIFTYYLKDGFKTHKQRRLATEAENKKAGKDNPYPSWDDLKREDREEKPSVWLTIRDAGGSVVRRMSVKSDKGLHRVAWDLRGPSGAPIDGKRPGPGGGFFFNSGVGALVLPGQYSATLSARVDGKLKPLGEAQNFTVKRLVKGTFEAQDTAALQAFWQEIVDLRRAVQGTGRAMGEVNKRIRSVGYALEVMASATEEQNQVVRALTTRMRDLSIIMNGDSTRSRRAAPAKVGINTRLFWIQFGHNNSFAAVTGTHRENLDVAKAAFATASKTLAAIEVDLHTLERALGADSPWTPGRLPAGDVGQN